MRGSSASQKRFNEEDLRACPFPVLSDEQIEETVEHCRGLVSNTLDTFEAAREIKAVAARTLAAAKRNIFDLLDDQKFLKIFRAADEAAARIKVVQ